MVVDKKNNLEETAQFIVKSKSFDNSTSCSADSVLIVDKNIYSKFINELEKNYVYILNDKEKIFSIKFIIKKVL